MTYLTIAVINYNTRELLRDCLLSLQRYAPMNAEVIIVDNASTDGSAELVSSEFPCFQLVANSQNLGFAKAVNQALRLGHGDYFLILNADVRLTPDCVEKLISYMDSHPRVGIAAPANITPNGEPMLTVHHDVTLRQETLRNLFFADVWRYRICGKRLAQRFQYPTAVDWVTGAALLVRREVIDAIGGMDEAVFLYGEEYDWQLRARKAGWGVHFIPGAMVIHHKSASANQKLNVQRYRIVTRSTYYFYVKHHGWRGLPALLFVHAVGSFLRMVLAGALRVLGRRQMRYQFREHALVLRDMLSLELYRWLFQTAKRAKELPG